MRRHSAKEHDRGQYLSDLVLGPDPRTKFLRMMDAKKIKKDNER